MAGGCPHHPGIILGTLIGTHVASLVPTRMLALIFTLFICYVSVQMIINLKPQAHRDLPGIFGTGLVGAGIGFISCLVAIGGGVLSVPFMTWCNVKMQNAIGTSSAIGFRLPWAGRSATSGMAGGGWLAVGQPWFCLRAGRGGGCRSERADCADRCPSDPPVAGQDPEAGLCRHPAGPGRQDDVGIVQRALNTGLRFSRKAASPSL
jgi:hypothetical protein